MKLTLYGNIPSLKNDKKIIYIWRNGKKTPSITASDRVHEWMTPAIQSLRLSFRGLKITGYPITVRLTFWFDNDRRHDLDNAAAGVMDAMTKAGVLTDDNVKYVDTLILKYGGIDRERPRCEIEFDD